MQEFLSLLSLSFIPSIITIILIYGLYKKKAIYADFCEGAKSGLHTAVEILPFIIAIFVGIEALSVSGALTFLENLLSPVLALLGIPEELISLILLRPVSGSGSLVVAERIMSESGPDSFVGRVAAVMTGTCETVFYVLALYFGVTSVKKMRHALAVGFAGYFAGVFAAVLICKFV